MQFSVYANSEHLAYRRMAEFVFAWLNELRAAGEVYIWNPLPLEPRYFAFRGYIYGPDPTATPEELKHYITFLDIRFSLPRDCVTWEEATEWIQDFNIIAESDIKLIGVEKTITSYS